MKAKIAVATVSGKDYYLLVRELKKKKIAFLSLMPDAPIPLDVEVIITTKKEYPLIEHEKVLIFEDGMEPEEIVAQALQASQGKTQYDSIVIGVDPGKIFGFAVIADGEAVRTGNCFSLVEISSKIKTIVNQYKNAPSSSICVRIGDGVPKYMDSLLKLLDETLPLDIVLQIVSEAGTNRDVRRTKHRRGIRDIASAVKIAGREGYTYQRKRINEVNN